MKRLYSEQRFYVFLILVAIFGLVGDRAWEWQKGVFLDDIFTPESFETIHEDQLRTIASDPSGDLSASADAPGSSGAPGSLATNSVNASATASAPVSEKAILSEAAVKYHHWRVAFATKKKKLRPPHSDIVEEVNKLLTLVGTTTQPFSKSEAYRLIAADEFLLAREVWVGKKLMLRKRAYGHLQESIKAFGANFESQWAMGLAVLTISHLNQTAMYGAEMGLGIRIDDELKTSTLGLMPFTDNTGAQMMLEVMLQVRDSRKQLAKEDAQVLTVVKQNVKNFRIQPARTADVKAADATLEKFRK